MLDAGALQAQIAMNEVGGGRYKSAQGEHRKGIPVLSGKHRIGNDEVQIMCGPAQHTEAVQSIDDILPSL